MKKFNNLPDNRMNDIIGEEVLIEYSKIANYKPRKRYKDDRIRTSNKKV